MGDGRLCASGFASALTDTVSLTTWGFGGFGGPDLQAVSIAQPAHRTKIGSVRIVRAICSIRIHPRSSPADNLDCPTPVTWSISHRLFRPTPGLFRLLALHPIRG